MNKHFRSIWAATVLAALTACGGGGGGAAPAPTDGAAQTVSVKLDRTQVDVQSSPDQSDAIAGAFFFFSGDTSPNVYVGMSTTFKGLALVNLSGDSTDMLQVSLRFKPAAAMPNGSYSDDVRIDVCWDAACTKHVTGSPLMLKATLTVSGSPVTTGEPATLIADPKGVLSHDVVAAQMSKALNAIVMVSSWPGNALYVYDMGTRTEKRLDLALAATGLTLSRDGLSAAVAHDTRFTHVDLASVGDAGGARTMLLNVSAPVFDLVLDDSAVIHALPADQSGSLYSVNLATKVETITPSSLYAKTRARLNPANGRVYIVDTQLFPQVFKSFTLDGNALPSDWRQSPYWGDYAIGNNFWFSEDGSRIYSASGNIFNASTTAASDMLYAGRLTLSAPAPNVSNALVWASHSALRREVATLDPGQCAGFAVTDCHTLLRIMDDDTYATRGSYWLHPVIAEQKFRPQQGLYVFHAADGTRFVISRLLGVIDKSHEHYITALPTDTL